MPRPLEGPHNLFGRWIASLCALHGITVSDLARQSGVHRNTLLGSMEEDNSGPSVKTVHQIWNALVELTQDSGLRESLPAAKEHLYNIAGYATPEQQAFSTLHLQVLEYFARDEKQTAEREAYIKRLEEDVKRLEMRRRPRTP